MRIGSLCTGYGGLDMAVGGELAFVSDIDPHVNRLLDERFPGIPNIGDITTQPDAPQVDAITAGFPCQPVSTAGRRKGTDDERWIFDDILALAGRMDPLPVLYLENVPGLLSANGGDAMARVVEGLAALGYVGRYRLLRASDIGACHRRERWFCIAVPQGRKDGAGFTRPEPVFDAEHANSSGRHPLEGVGQGEGTVRGNNIGGTSQVAFLGTPRAADGMHQPLRTWFDGNPRSRLEDQVATLPTPTAQAAKHSADDRGPGTLDDFNLWSVSARLRGTWGDYADAIARHTHTIGREPPAPTVDGRLNPAFVEWMMMLPAGWVTDLDLSRTAQLKILGNGVVPPQAAAAFGLLAT